jgi:glc operon protein GlcG
MRNRPGMTAADVAAIATACREEARRLGLAVTFCIVDDGGHLLHLERLDARPSTVDVAIGKARTSALMRIPTGAFEARVRENPHFTKLDAMPLQGGLPLFYAQEPVGAIGVSGAMPAQDEAIAQAGCAALGALPPP